MDCPARENILFLLLNFQSVQSDENKNYQNLVKIYNIFKIMESAGRFKTLLSRGVFGLFHRHY
jgi:hypothetical protein